MYLVHIHIVEMALEREECHQLERTEPSSSCWQEPVKVPCHVPPLPSCWMAAKDQQLRRETLLCLVLFVGYILHRFQAMHDPVLWTSLLSYWEAAMGQPLSSWPYWQLCPRAFHQALPQQPVPCVCLIAVSLEDHFWCAYLFVS